MFWKPRKPTWYIDPSRVALASIVGNGGRNLSRSHVKVKYRLDGTFQFEPLPAFIRRCHEAMNDGRALEIERLVVAPIIQQRHNAFFDRLTDWGPARRRAYQPTSGRKRPGLEDGVRS
jgi:hypothetical protein